MIFTTNKQTNRWSPLGQYIAAEFQLPSRLSHLWALLSHCNLWRVQQVITTTSSKMRCLINKPGMITFKKKKKIEVELWSWSKELVTRKILCRLKCRTIFLPKVVSIHSCSHQYCCPFQMIWFWMELLGIKKCHFGSLCH
jgi:hypothetical protein